MEWIREMLGRVWESWRGSFKVERQAMGVERYRSEHEGMSLEIRVERFVNRVHYNRRWIRDRSKSIYRVWCTDVTGSPVRVNRKILHPAHYPELANPVLAGTRYSYVLAARAFLESQLTDNGA